MKPAGPSPAKRPSTSGWPKPDDRMTRTPGSMAQPPEGLLAAQAGHREVEQHHVDARALLAEEQKAPLAVLGGQHLDALLLQQLAHHLAHRRLVVDQQHRRRARRARRARSRRRVGRPPDARGEQQAERRPPAGRALDAQRPPVPAHHAPHHGQAQPAAGELGGEEGIEDALDHARLDPRAVVRDLERDVAAGRERRPARPPRARVPGADLAYAGRDADGSAPRPDRLARVDHEVHQHLLELPDVGSTGGSSSASRASSLTPFGSVTSSSGRFSRTSALRSTGVTSKRPCPE
jgi:hypothetical protein